MNTVIPLMFGAILGAASIYFYLSVGSENVSSVNIQEGKKPLYWVAPMDANYRRDKPGKSPMGMDLIPVYAKDKAHTNDAKSVVEIAPHVVNNLGVRTAPVTFKQVSKEITTVGYVQYDEDMLIHIHPRIAGWIEKLYVKAAGNPVKEGQALYSLYSPQLVNAQEELLIAVKRKNKTLIDAAKARLTALQISDSFIDNLVQTGEIKQTVTFYSPQSGVIDGLKIREGFYVDPGNTLMSIGQITHVWVETEVFERDAASVKQGQSVTMTLDYLPGKKWQGIVDYVYPTLNASTRTLSVRLKFANPNGLLKPNMFAQVSIKQEATERAIWIPKEAVIRTGKNNRVVKALGDGKFTSAIVVIGQVYQQEVEILEGLTTDDVVVTSAQFLIDSESNKYIDVNRMTQPQPPVTTWIKGEVNQVMPAHKMINISHESVPDWNWPEMTMDFMIDSNVDMAVLKRGQMLHFEVMKDAEQFVVTQIHIVSEPQVSQATVNGIINNIDHEERRLNISRDAIEKWGREAAKMDFIAAKNVDLSAFKAGEEVIFTFEVRDEFIVTNIVSQHRQNALHKKHADH
ncbi:efflux RND transporter periplasmic adaptor subunit [Thalassotalea sediminis]|uniref:efflux RND transporter periplasmic adaptor subunit n=1 Tax=Thalassotalea sediminis TaxID=1759089 RepID=UPI003D9B316F